MPLEKMLEPNTYRESTKGWHKAYGPDVMYNPAYGRADFNGHSRWAGSGFGTDYSLDFGFPLVPLTSCLHTDWRDGSHPAEGRTLSAWPLGTNNLKFVYAHLHSIVPKAVSRERAQQTYKMLTRRDIIALSGDSGRVGPVGPHLHVTFGQLRKDGRWVDIDYEKWNMKSFGIDNGKPVFWDCRTPLDIPMSKQFPLLRGYIANELALSLQDWEKDSTAQELAGRILEYKNLIGDVKGKNILDSKHFHDMRSLLATEVITKERYAPGSGPYAAKLAVHSYGRDPTQRVLLTLPYLSPDVVHLHRIPKFEGGLHKKKGADEWSYDGKPCDGTMDRDEYVYGHVWKESGITIKYPQ